MSNPTSNFGWQMPTATDLVTDLPADFEVFGQAVDTDLADLNGGTTGQLLSKTSNTDLDFTWVTPNAGDITGVTAGTGISGGGTSGDVTVTNSMATAIDAKGDLIAGTGADAFSRLGVGANDTILTADSSQATGLKWAAASGGGANWSLLNSGGTALTGAATITISGISGKDKIMALVRGGSAGALSEIDFRLNGDTGNNYYGVGAFWGGTGVPDNNTLRGYNNGGISVINLARQGNSGPDIFSGGITFTGCNSSGVKAFEVNGAGGGSGGINNHAYMGQGYWDNSATVTSISILSSVGNFDAGTIYIYASA